MTLVTWEVPSSDTKDERDEFTDLEKKRGVEATKRMKRIQKIGAGWACQERTIAAADAKVADFA